MKAHVIDQSRNESIVMSHYFLPPANHQSLTGRPIFLSHLHTVTGKSKSKVQLHPGGRVAHW